MCTVAESEALSRKNIALILPLSGLEAFSSWGDAGAMGRQLAYWHKEEGFGCVILRKIRVL